MGNFIQIHTLTIFPPSCLNRDDLGKPKTARIGGADRLRISSQSLKRAYRSDEGTKKLLEGHMGVRTQRLGSVIIDYLKTKGLDDKKSVEIAREIAGVFGKVKNEKDANSSYTEQLTFISPEEQEAAFLYADARASGDKAAEQESNLKKQLLRFTDTAADIGMFGRMLAADPSYNREAAVSVAHAFTTHRAIVEDDFYTAVDDLKLAAEDAGAGFVGEAGFGSGVFYGYINVDIELLLNNLNGDREVAKKAVEALITAAATVAPGGKSASYASFAKASYVLIELGKIAPRTLAGAFEKPIDRVAAHDESYTDASIRVLRSHREALARAYGENNAKCELSVSESIGTLNEVVGFAVGAI